MLKIKRDKNQEDFKIVDPFVLSNMNNFQSLEVMKRVSDTQLQMSENSTQIIWRLKGQS